MRFDLICAVPLLGTFSTESTQSGHVEGYDPGSLVSVVLRLEEDLREATISRPAARRSARCCPANFSIVNAVLIQRMLIEPWTRLPSVSGTAIPAKPSSYGGVP